MNELELLRVFVVEDHAFQRGALVNILRALGVQQIEEAANGREALAALERAGPQATDVILCDLEMPEMDGIEFLRTVAERRLARGVVIVSGREPEILRSVDAMVRAMGLAVLGRLKKPPSIEALRRALSSEPHPDPGHAAAPVLAADQLRRALDAGEFHAEFQPKVSFVDGALTGVEALARWQRSDGPPVGPDVFVPALVHAGLVTSLSERILEDACRALKTWDAAGLSVAVSVNLSGAVVSGPAVVDRLLGQVLANGVDPRRITFEVTETEVMADIAAMLNVMARLRLKGFGLSIDDFGTGYSSLAQLNTIPFTELKIDQAFVHKCPRSRHLRSIVEATVALARQLGLNSVAEGVTTRDEWDLLAALGCKEAQGFGIAPAMPAAELPAWAARWPRRLEA